MIRDKRFTNCDRCGMRLYTGDKVDIEVYDHNSVYQWTYCARCTGGLGLTMGLCDGPTLVTVKINHKAKYGFYPEKILTDIMKYTNEFDYDIGGF